MLVRAKTRDIAILRTMGASRRGDDEDLHDRRPDHRRARHRRSASILGAIFLFFRQGVVNVIQLVTGQNLWDPSVRFLTELPSKTDPFEVAAIVVDHAGADLPRDAVPGAEGGQHRPGPGAAL